MSDEHSKCFCSSLFIVWAGRGFLRLKNCELESKSTSDLQLQFDVRSKSVKLLKLSAAIGVAFPATRFYDLLLALNDCYNMPVCAAMLTLSAKSDF